MHTHTLTKLSCKEGETEQQCQCVRRTLVMSESVLVVDIGGVCGAVLQHEQCHDIEAPAHHPPTPTQPVTISPSECASRSHTTVVRKDGNLILQCPKAGKLVIKWHSSSAAAAAVTSLTLFVCWLCVHILKKK